jgi:hypothetical protein
MPDTRFGCLATIIGSMPHTDPARACSLVTQYLKEIPAWPQLPKRSFKEGMSAQFSQGFPGIVIKDSTIFVDRSQDWDEPLEELYNAYLENKADKYPITTDYAAGLHQFLSLTNLKPVAVKGQVTGPVSFGLSVTDDGGRAILYDDMLSDAASKLLRLKATWQEKKLARISKNTIIFVDEPSMTSYGSAYFAAAKEKVVGLIEEVLRGIGGLKGIHCCGNTDWPVLLDTSTDILSFDAYNYAQSLSLYPDDVKKFLDRGGAVAWGIVPNEDNKLTGETASSLKDRLEEAIAPFTRKGVAFNKLIEQGLLTPSCALAGMSEEGAENALGMLDELSHMVRKR